MQKHLPSYFEHETFKISPNWDYEQTLYQIIWDSKFIFLNGKRPRIVMKTPLHGCNCIEIDYDRYGLRINAETIFTETLGETIVDSSKDIVQFIKEFLIKEEAKDLIK